MTQAEADTLHQAFQKMKAYYETKNIQVSLRNRLPKQEKKTTQ